MYGIDTKCAYQTAGKGKAAGTHSCLHSSLGLLSLEKEPHRGFRGFRCMQKRPQLRGPDPPAKGTKSSASAAGNYTVTAAKPGSAPPGQVLPAEAVLCCWLEEMQSCTYCYCLLFFSSLAFCCCLMLYSFWFSLWTRLLHFLHLSLGIFGKWRNIYCVGIYHQPQCHQLKESFPFHNITFPLEKFNVIACPFITSCSI